MPSGLGPKGSPQMLKPRGCDREAQPRLRAATAGRLPAPRPYTSVPRQLQFQSLSS